MFGPLGDGMLRVPQKGSPRRLDVLGELVIRL